MDRADDFDPSAYMTCPRLDIPSLIALCRQLLAVAPTDLFRPAEVCKRALSDKTRALEEGYKAAQAEGASSDKRPVDIGADNSWSCLKSRLEPHTWLDEERFPDASRAKVLMRRIFPTGLAFTQLEYGAQWAEASWRIQILADEKLEPELRRLCGDVFVDELFHWHAQYGKMVGVVPARRGGRASGGPRPNLGELRRQATQSVVAWQTQLVAMHVSGHETARAALRPTDDYREKNVVPARPAVEPTPPPAPGPVPGPSPLPPV